MNRKMFAATLTAAAVMVAWPASALADEGPGSEGGYTALADGAGMSMAAPQTPASDTDYPASLTANLFPVGILLGMGAGEIVAGAGFIEEVAAGADVAVEVAWEAALHALENAPSANSDKSKSSKPSSDSQGSTSAKEPGGRPDDAVPPPKQSSPSSTSKKDAHVYVEEIPDNEIVVDTAAGIMWIWNPSTGKWEPYPIPDQGTGGGSGGGGGKDAGPTGGERGGYGDDSSDDNAAQDGGNNDNSASGGGNGSQGDNSSSQDDSSSSQGDSSSPSSSGDSSSSPSSSGDSSSSPSDSNGSSTDDGNQCSGTCGSGGGDEMGNPDAPGGDGPGGDETSAPWTGKLTTPVDAETALENLDSGPQVDENIVTAPLGKGVDAEVLDKQQPVTQDPGGEGIALNLAGVESHGSSVGTTSTDGWGDKPLTMAQTVAAPRMNVGSVSLSGGLTR